MTKIHHEFEGDRHFPEFDETNWKLVSSERGIKDEKTRTIMNFWCMKKEFF